jgi:dTDP-4-dehydrorhamnose 3,5-epimerase and related enzymes
MKKIKTKFKDLFIVSTKVFKDKRGWLKEEFKKNFIKKNLVFTLVSSSKKNVLRGLHMQIKKPQDKFLSVLKGRVLDVAVDLRKNSKTYVNI